MSSVAQQPQAGQPEKCQQRQQAQRLEGRNVHRRIRRPNVGIALPLDARAPNVRAAGAVALPHRHEVAGAIGRHRRTTLVRRGVGVDLELASDRQPARVEALGLDAVARPVRAAGAVAGPRLSFSDRSRWNLISSRIIVKPFNRPTMLVLPRDNWLSFIQITSNEPLEGWPG